MATWIDFDAVQTKVSIQQVLERYGVLGKLVRKKGELVGRCPIHKGSNPTQFHVSLATAKWNCFGDCHGGGQGVISFVAAMEGLSKKDISDRRKATLLLMEWFGIQGERPSKREQSEIVREAEGSTADTAAAKPSATPSAEPAKEEKINPPLKFALKSLDATHPYLKERGLTEETIATFGVGYFTGKGMMAGRIAVPIHNEHGELVAYIGRWPGDEGWSEGEGKYKLPGGFHKSLVVFNLHRAREHAKAKGLILVEGLFDCMKVHQAGYHNVVSLLGSSISDTQEQLILDAVGPNGKIALMFDGDESGRKCCDGLIKDGAWEPGALRRLASRVYVRAIDLADGLQPDKMREEDIRALLG
jgi:DNA primase